MSSETEPRANLEKIRELGDRELAYVLQESYRFSQGEKEPQLAYLALAARSIKECSLSCTTTGILQQFKSINMGSHGQERLVPDPSSTSYLFESERPEIAGLNLPQDGILPMKEIRSGGHQMWIRPDTDAIVSFYIKKLFEDSEKAVEELAERFIFEVMVRDAHYSHSLSEGPSSAFKGVIGIPGLGRPGTGRTENPEEYDNPRKDKYFSYIVAYLLKGIPPPHIEFSGGITKNVIDLVRSSAVFKALLKGVANDITIEKQGTAPLQRMFDELVERYNVAHTIGEVDLAVFRQGQ